MFQYLFLSFFMSVSFYMLVRLSVTRSVSRMTHNLLIGAISYLLYFLKPLALCSCIASIFRGQMLVFHGFWVVVN